MLNNEAPSKSTVLTVPARSTEIVLSDEADHPFALILPPIEDLAEISDTKTSILAHDLRRSEQLTRLVQAFSVEYERELSKSKKYGAFPTFHSRLAELASAAGRFDEQEQHLAKARELSKDVYFEHRHIDLLVSRSLLSNAQAATERLDLTSDVYANLRMAMFRLYQNRQEEAFQFVEQAKSIDPLDSRVRMFEGGLCLQRRDFRQAVHAFRMAAHERPTSCIVFSNMAVAYIGMGQVESAFSSLRKAVALGPLNVNAICLLADLAHEYERSEDAIPALRHIVCYEKQRPELWARLARACIELKLFDEALASLRHEAAIDGRSSTWNNMGVVYGLRGDSARAQQCFKKGMESAGTLGNRDFLIAAMNLSRTMADAEDPMHVSQFVDEVIKADRDRIAIQSDDLSSLYSTKILALARASEGEESEKIAFQCLEAEDSNPYLRAWSVGYIVSRDALWHKNLDRIPTLIATHIDEIERFAANKKLLRVHTLNNIAFALAETGRTEDAERILRLIGDEELAGQAYPLATLGLIQMRRGRIEKGRERYEQAIGAAVGRVHKNRIRQKLNLELANAVIHENPGKALRLLERVAAERHGEPALASVAQKEMASLPKPVGR
jgi:Flp pilus assembly protein TadD